MFRTGYITTFGGDAVWFLGLPFFALAFAMASQAWLPPIAMVSVALWIEVPHHFTTFLRTYGLSDDWQRFRDRLIIGPIVILSMTALGLVYAPLTVALVTTLWNQQHFLMQLHGFTRIYDFKARTGAPDTGKWDMTLNWVLYGNMFLTAPLFVKLWVRELYRFGLPITAQAVRTIETLSWTGTAVFLVLYIAYQISSVRKGYAVNPVKYLFILFSYGVLYFVSWNTASVLVHAIANTIMHGLQYNVIVYWYIRRKVEQTGTTGGLIARLVRPGNAVLFALFCLLYAVLFQLLSGKPLHHFGFGLVNLTSRYDAIPALSIDRLNPETGIEILALALLSLPGILHLYFDSFIWKVRDAKVQRGL
ncbi:MAG: hypothetical protein AB7O26_04620 [Planctomycetaceae bacterium]